MHSIKEKELRILIMCPSGAKCPHVDCYFSELHVALEKSILSGHHHYPLANEVAKGYSNATVLP